MPTDREFLTERDESITSKHGAVKITVHHDTLKGGQTVWALPGQKKTTNRRYAQNLANVIESHLMADMDRRL